MQVWVYLSNDRPYSYLKNLVSNIAKSLQVRVYTSAMILANNKIYLENLVSNMAESMQVRVYPSNDIIATIY